MDTNSPGDEPVPDAVAPAWTRGEIEAPAGEKNMGGSIAGVYTEEQQARLGVDEWGDKVETKAEPALAVGGAIGITTLVEIVWQWSASDPVDTVVEVAGTFNSWVPTAMDRQDDGTYRWAGELSDGRTYQLKFIVGGVWQHDKTWSTVADGSGGCNNQVLVSAAGTAAASIITQVADGTVFDEPPVLSRRSSVAEPPPPGHVTQSWTFPPADDDVLPSDGGDAPTAGSDDDNEVPAAPAPVPVAYSLFGGGADTARHVTQAEQEQMMLAKNDAAHHRPNRQKDLAAVQPGTGTGPGGGLVSGVRNGWGNMGPSHADKTGKKGTKKIKQPDDGMACEVTMKMSIEPKKKKKKKKKKVTPPPPLAAVPTDATALLGSKDGDRKDAGCCCTIS